MKPRVWIIITLILLVLATALHIAGLLTPCWIFLETSDFRVGVGLYFRVGCEASSGDNCTHPSFPTDLPFGYNSASTYDEPEWEAVLWLQTIAAVFALLLCVMMAVYLVGFGAWRRMGVLNMLMTCFSVATWLVAIAGLIVYVVSYGKVITRSPDISGKSFPWSVLMVFFAAILFIIITILIRLRCRNRNYMQNAIPTSADSKMALNPSTRNQVMKRYFTPSPYREDRREAIANQSAPNSLTPVGQEQSQQLGLQHNGFGPRALEHINNNGNIRYDNGWHEETWTHNLIQTHQLHPGVTTMPAAAVAPRDNVHHRSIDNGVVITSLSTRPQNNPQLVYRQHQQLQQLQGQQQQQQLQQLQGQQQQQQQQQRLQLRQLQHSRVQTNTDVLADTEIDNFDSETIIYKGGGDVKVTNFSFVNGVSTDNDQRDRYGYSFQNIEGRGGHVNGAFATEDVGRWEEQRTAFHSTEFLTPPPPNRDQRSSSIGSFRIGAEHQDVEPVKELYTTHMRRVNQGAERAITGAPSSSGKGFDYNRKFMYRPYSEQSY